MLVQVKKKAQITIPLKIREAAGIAEGDVLNVEVKNKEIVLMPVKRRKIKLKLVPAKKLKELEGIFSLGGDAVKDTEAIWDDA
ncbi:MAG: AbrB/MazE/SpoVT family DNA-binding domain-containing protein [Nitrospirae bacterium]|nr:AbrB/MazE/SpoVT family DNA-binding domain-containing protein [Nitrospirota bacterium]